MINCFLERIHHIIHTNPILINTHVHQYDELTYYIYGKGTTCIEDNKYNYKDKTFAFYRARHPHNEDNHVSSNIIYLRFNFDIADLVLKEGVFDDPDETLLPILRKLRNISEDHSNIYRSLMVECCLTELLLTAAGIQNIKKRPVTNINWKQVVDYIDDNSNSDIDFEALARKYNYSYSRFRHLFSEKFGISPTSYLINHRIETAKMLINNTSFSITDIAYNCGFGSSSQFTNIFKNRVGIIPSEYRKRNR